MQPWQEVLKQIGYPTTCVVIDFETFFDSDYTLADMTIPEYLADERFEFTGVGIGEMTDKTFDISFIPNCKTKPSGYLVEDRIANLFRYKWGDNYENITVTMQNAPFDAMILLKKFGIDCPYIIDTADLARHLEPRASAKLAHVAPRYGLEEKGKTVQFKGLRYGDMDMAQRLALRTYTQRDIKLQGQLFQIMLPLIQNVEHEIKLMQYTRNLMLHSPIKFDFEKAEILIDDMMHELDSKIAVTGLTHEDLSGDLSFVKILQNELPWGENVPTKPHKRPGKKMTALLGKPGVGPALAKDDAGMKDLLVHENETVRQLMEARQAVGSWPTHIKRIERMYRTAAANGGTLPIATYYYGAHTSRWTGAWGYNCLNFGSRSHELINQIRHLLEAPAGYKFIINDWAQIEARFLAWWAGQDDLVAEFAENKDVYSSFASDLFKTRVRKPKKSDPEQIVAFLTPKRHTGKETILGGGYGMGYKKFFERMKANDTLRDMIVRGIYDLRTAKRAIEGYRNRYPKIPELWNETEKGFKHVIQRPRDCTYELPKGFSVSSIGDTVTLNFPTGRQMVYHNCHIKRTNKGSTIKWKYGYLWGGTIVENAVQSACRDIMTNSWIRCEEAGIPIVFQLYDELVTMTVTPKVKKVSEKMRSIMVDVPEWAAGCPLDVETTISKHYTK